MPDYIEGPHFVRVHFLGGHSVELFAYGSVTLQRLVGDYKNYLSKGSPTFFSGKFDESAAGGDKWNMLQVSFKDIAAITYHEK